jgi:sarcosine oxidase subunit beta
MTVRAADVIVVGAGIVGSLVARNLGQLGFDVLVIEADQIAAGASGGIGMRGLRATGRDIRELPLAARSHALWADLNDELHLDPGTIQNVGLVTLVDPAGGGGWLPRMDLDAIIAVHAAFDIPLSLLHGQEISDRVGAQVQGANVALYAERDGIGDHTAITTAIAEDAQKKGAQVVEGHPVIKVEDDGFSTTVWLRNGETYTGKKGCVVTTNASARELLLGSFEVDLPIGFAVPMYGILRPVRAFEITTLVEDSTRRFALKSIGDNRVMLSGEGRGRWTESGASSDIGAFGLKLADLVARFPQLHDAEIEIVDASRPEATTYDGVPIIDRVPGAENVVFATGWCGHGFMIAPAVAEALTSWIVSGSQPALLRPLALNRFR